MTSGNTQTRSLIRKINHYYVIFEIDNFMNNTENNYNEMLPGHSNLRNTF